MPAEDFAGQAQHVIAFAIAIYIVIGFEVIEIYIAGAEARAVFQQPVYMFIDRNVARQ
ncbi:hypothetical protein D3C73_1578110 [compost metagenome]